MFIYKFVLKLQPPNAPSGKARARMPHNRIRQTLPKVTANFRLKTGQALLHQLNENFTERVKIMPVVA